MSQHYQINQYFSTLSFSQKTNMSYTDWCLNLLSIYGDKRFYSHIKMDLLYSRGYFSFVDIFFYIACLFIFISNIVLFPIYALILKSYWGHRYNKIIKSARKHKSEILVNSPQHSHLNGAIVLNVLSIVQGDNTNSPLYTVILTDKSIHTLSSNELLFKDELLEQKLKLDQEIKRLEALQREVNKIDYQLSLFEK